MKILVIGSGGREHALCWKIKRSPLVRRVYCAPGNAGIAKDAECVNIKASDIESLIRFAISEQIDLTVVGPEAPLADGIVDKFEDAGLKIFGSSKAASELESSKVFSKNLMKKHGIPTAFYSSFTDIDDAMRWVREVKPPLVVKADGLAAGKGVFICKDEKEAENALETMLFGKRFGDAGSRVVIEEFLEGEEASFFAFTDGKRVLPLESSQDHKALLDGDKGPNTGGMGAYSPAPVVTEDIYKKIMNEVIKPTIRAMREEGRPYKGVLYAGLMIRDGNIKTLEFNCRFGDPEAQPLFMRMKSDIVPLLMAVADGDIAGQTVEWKDEAAVCVVMAAKGYPGDYKKGLEITGLNEADSYENVKVFHAGTSFQDNKIVTNGGRVLGVTALGKTIPETTSLVYRAVNEIGGDALQYRTDIAQKALKYL